MELMVVLNGLEQLEGTLALVYAHFSQALRSNEAVSDLFRRLSEDEYSHRQKVRYQQRLVRRNPKRLAEIDVDLSAVGRLTGRATAFLHTEYITVDAALNFAIEVEYEAAEYHLKNALSQTNPSLTKLLRALGTADEGHVGLLREFISKGTR